MVWRALTRNVPTRRRADRVGRTTAARDDKREMPGLLDPRPGLAISKRFTGAHENNNNELDELLRTRA